MIKYLSIITLLILIWFPKTCAGISYDSLSVSIRDSLELLDQASCIKINIEIAKKIAVHDKQRSKEYANRAIDCDFQNEDNEELYNLYKDLGGLYFSNWGEADEAISFIQQALQYTESYADSSRTLSLLGILHGEKGALDLAIDYFHRALLINEKNDLFIESVVTKANIAKAYELAGDQEQSLVYYNQILSEEIGSLDTFERANYMRMTAALYKKQGDLKKSETIVKEALKILPEKKAIQEAVGYDVLNGLYIIIADINIEKNQLNKALEYTQKALKLSIQENNIEHILDAKLMLLNIQFDKGDYGSAIDTGLELVNQIEESESKIRGNNVHLLVSKAYKASENYEKALFHYVKYDSLTNVISSEQAKNNILLTEQKSIAKQNENLRGSEQFYKQLSNRRFETISLLSLLAVFMLGLIFLLLKIKNENADLTSQLKVKNVELENYIDSNIKLEQFAYLASHDMKTPLRSISSYTGLLKMKNKDKLSPKSLEYMTIIENASSRLFNLVTDLLDYAKVNSQVINHSTFELGPLISEIKEDLDFEIKRNLGTIKINANDQTIYGDRQKIKKVFSNLLNNSLKFSFKDKPVVIEIDVVHLNDKIKVSVTDNGIGISEDFHKEMFMPYSRFHCQDEYEGTGLGLTIVKEIIDKHEGEISCSSNVGKGTTFEITLPFEKAA